MKKKYTVLLSCALCLSLLAACAGKPAGGDAEKEQGAAVETSQRSEQQAQGINTVGETVSAGAPENSEQTDLPARDVWVEQYFHAVSGYNTGAAGSSLAEAQAACAAFGFAADHQLWSVDVRAMRDSML